MPTCAYCGTNTPTQTDDHVIPQCPFPPNIPIPDKHITVPACGVCNNSYADDEAHFRNVMVVAGEPNEHVYSLWNGKTKRAFAQCDGEKRKRDLRAIMKEFDTPDGIRHKIYPARDERVLRILKKIIRGLSAYHGFPGPIHDNKIWTDVMRYKIPDYLDVVWHGIMPSIAAYTFYDNESEGTTAWGLKFFETRLFIGVSEYK